MWNSGISNWGAGVTEGNTLGLGKKRSYADTGFSTDNNGSYGAPSTSYMKNEYGLGSLLYQTTFFMRHKDYFCLVNKCYHIV